MSPLICNQCDRSFSKKSNLKRHISTIHVEHVKTHNSQLKTFHDDKMDITQQLVSNQHIRKISRLKYDCNTFQKRLYEENKLNFHLNKVHIDNQ